MRRKTRGKKFSVILVFTLTVLIVLSLMGSCGEPPAQEYIPEADEGGGVTAMIDIPIITIPVQETEPSETGSQVQEERRLPEGFVYTTDIVPDAVLEIRYYSTYNFVGTRVDGYLAPVSIMTREAAEALKTASDILVAQGYVIKIFDSYRPEDAVAHFVSWGSDVSDTKMKEYFYPSISKSDLFNGYIAKRSGHSRGSTIDLTIIDMKTGKEVDMGGPFDFLGEISHHDTANITPAQAANRLILKNAMIAAGFKPYSAEWWHYTLINEPFPSTYFNFPVE